MAKAATGRRRGPAPPGRHSISDQLRDIIDSRGLSGYRVGQLSGVSPGVVARFMSGQRGLTLETLDRLGHGLNLRLVEVAARRRPVRPRADEPPAILDPGADPAAEGGIAGEEVGLTESPHDPS